jgi:hypothetical protein
METHGNPIVYHAKKGGPHFDFGVKKKVEEKKGSGGGGIRCPKCRWMPRAHDRWMCHCRHTWNTFDTRGKCPGCGHQWTQTKCLACREWSEHEDWYERENPS